MKYRIFIFALAFALLFGAVPVQEVKAEEDGFVYVNDFESYMTLEEAFEHLGWSDIYDYFLSNYSNLLSCPYYFIYSCNDSTRYLVYFFDNAPYCLGFNSDEIYCYNSKISGSFSSSDLVYFNKGLDVDIDGRSMSGAYSDDYRMYSYRTTPNSIELFVANFPFYMYDPSGKVVNSLVGGSSHTHTFFSKETVPTCTTSGKTWEECSCGEIQNEVEVPALGHTWVTNTEDSTCTVAGKTWDSCSVCGEIQNEISLDLAVHTWVSKEELGSCTKDSRTWEECSVCGAVQNEVVTPSSGHVWVTNEVPATCVDNGSTWEECGCGEIQNDTVIPALGHTWISNTDESTCTVAGKTWEQCSFCGEIQNETVLELASHAWEMKEEVGSCTVDSKTWEECSVCGAVQNEVVTPSSGHVWVTNEIPVTCAENGRIWDECSCGEIQNDTTIPALGHTFVVKEKTGNCIVDGKTWDECSSCGAVQNIVVTPAVGHTYDDDNDSVCNVCNYNRHIEKSVDFLDMIPVILSLFLVFPLNIFLALNLILLGIILYRVLKRS